jgi:hypothetical protein
MPSDNSNYESRIASNYHDGVTSDKRKRISVWKECLINHADLPTDLVKAIEQQAAMKNHSKPIGLYFNNMDWVEDLDEEFSQKLADGEVTKHGSLIESCHMTGRRYPLEAKFDESKPCAYEPVSQTIVTNALVRILNASELGEPDAVKSGEYATLREYVEGMVEIFEDKIETPAPPA